MIPTYRFSIKLGSNGDKKYVVPIYSDDMTLDFEKETNQKFFRAKLSGKINFVRSDFDFINEAPFETDFYLTMERSVDNGKTFQIYRTFMFHKTDCTFNEDDKLVSVSPQIYDQYNDVLAGIEKEYDLIKLSVEAEYLDIYKRGLIQLYIPGDSVISCFLNATYWEQDVQEVITDTEELINTYYFAQNTLLAEFNLTAENGASSDYNGIYGGTHNNTEGDFYAQNMQYRLRYVYDIGNNQETYALYEASGTQALLYRYQGTGKISNKTIYMDAFQSYLTGRIKVEINAIDIYARFLCDVENIGEQTTYTIPQNDICADNRNYKRVIGYGVKVGQVSVLLSDDATEWGIAPNRQYYLPPYSLIGSIYLPVARSKWQYASFWYKYDPVEYNILENKSRKAYTLRDAFKLSSCINVLLKQIAPGITHEPTPEYSQFLYGDNPIRLKDFTLFITPKSNILNGEYQTPAQKAPITLQAITSMLANMLNCYWYIEDGKFKIEHTEFFRNGGSYNVQPSVGIDLTEIYNTRNGKKWGFDTSEYSYDKLDMPEQYQYSWMDDATELFDGYPVEINSKYVQSGKIEDVNISNFTSDIDFMLLNPSAITSDGFAIFAAISNSGKMELPIIEQTVMNVTYYVQNGYLAMAYLQPNFLIYDMPARNIVVNEQNATAKSISKKKKQTVNYPLYDVDVTKLVKTYIGNGQVEKLSLTLSSNNVKTTLNYDTE